MMRLPTRTVHLDFHTGPAIEDVAKNFDADVFAGTLRDACVQSVTLFAKCHHGHLYYETDRAERHPGLPKSLNLLDEQVEALHRVGIKAPIYLSLQVDEYAANENPEWLAVAEDLRQVKHAGSVFEAGWQVLDMSSPYAEYFADQLQEVLTHFGVVDGIFLDMCWDQPSSSAWAIASMRKGRLDPADPRDRDRHAREVAHRYMELYRSMVTPYLASDAQMSVWFNSRPKTALVEEVKYVSHVEIEALPTGGWGYGYFPYVARFVAPLGVPMLAHTGRFHKSWGDSGGLKPSAALKYECSQMLAHGVSAGVGDVLHPRGKLEPATYNLIGDVFQYLARCEPFVAGGTSVTEAAVLMDPALGDAPGPVGVGIVRAFQQLRVQFTLVSPDSDLQGIPLVVVPECTRVSPETAARLDNYLNAGGRLLIAGAASVGLDGSAPVLDCQGVDFEGPSPYTQTFLRDTAADTDEFPHVMYEPMMQMRPRLGTEILYEAMEPYFERTWDRFSGHDYTPVDGPSGYAAAVVTGNVATIAAPIFTAYGKHGLTIYREVLRRCIQRLMPDPLVRINGPTHLETTVVDTTQARVVHLLSFLASRQAEGVSPLTRAVEGIDIAHDPFPLVRLSVGVRLPARPSRVTLQPHNIELDAKYSDGYASVVVSLDDGHGLIVFERPGDLPNGKAVAG